MEMDDITGMVVDSALYIHRAIGPGLLESVYETVMSRILLQKGLKVVRQYPIDFEFDGLLFREAGRLDMLVEDKVILELKSVECLAPVHCKQLLTYLRLLNLEVGLLINFGDAIIKDGIKRIINNYNPILPPQSISPGLRVNNLHRSPI